MPRPEDNDPIKGGRDDKIHLEIDPGFKALLKLFQIHSPSQTKVADLRKPLIIPDQNFQQSQYAEVNAACELKDKLLRKYETYIIQYHAKQSYSYLTCPGRIKRQIAAISNDELMTCVKSVYNVLEKLYGSLAKDDILKQPLADDLAKLRAAIKAANFVLHPPTCCGLSSFLPRFR